MLGLIEPTDRHRDDARAAAEGRGRERARSARCSRAPGLPAYVKRRRAASTSRAGSIRTRSSQAAVIDRAGLRALTDRSVDRAVGRRGAAAAVRHRHRRRSRPRVPRRADGRDGRRNPAGVLGRHAPVRRRGPHRSSSRRTTSRRPTRSPTGSSSWIAAGSRRPVGRRRRCRRVGRRPGVAGLLHGLDGLVRGHRRGARRGARDRPGARHPAGPGSSGSRRSRRRRTSSESWSSRMS